MFRTCTMMIKTVCYKVKLNIRHFHVQAMNSKLVAIVTLFALFHSVLSFNTYHSFAQHNKTEILSVDGAVGPESIAFDSKGEGPYTGVADGRILMWKGDGHGWVDFAVTTSKREKCVSPYAPELEDVCGRTLGLQFNKKTGDLYIADSYLGLHVVGPAGGLARPLVTKVEGKPLLFTNNMDIDEEEGAIYFTDSSTVYRRRQIMELMLTGDKTGRLMKYDISNKKVTILLQGVAFANGVALSKDRSFVLVAETITGKIIRYWLKGPIAGKHDTFAQLYGFPDNICRNSKGEFWVALSATSVKLSDEGEGMETLLDLEGNISEAHENDGKLWLGSVIMPFIRIYNL